MIANILLSISLVLATVSALPQVKFDNITTLKSGDNCQHIYGPLPISYPQDFGSKSDQFILDSIWITGFFINNGFKYGLHIGFRCLSPTCTTEDAVCGYDISISDSRKNKFVKGNVDGIKLTDKNASFTDKLVNIGNLHIERIGYDQFIFSALIDEYNFLVTTQIVTKDSFIPLSYKGFFRDNFDDTNHEGTMFFSHVTEGNGIMIVNNDTQLVTSQILFNRYYTSNVGWMAWTPDTNYRDRWTLVYLSDGTLLHLYIPYYGNYSRSTYVATGSFYENGVSHFLKYEDFTYEPTTLWVSSNGNPYLIDHTIHVPKFNLSLATKPLILDNELAQPDISFNYYEAISNFYGFHNGIHVTGCGITEISQVI